MAFSLTFASSSKNRIYPLLVRTVSYGEQQGVRDALTLQVVLVRADPNGLRLIRRPHENLAAFDGIVRVAGRVGEDVQRVHQTESRSVFEEGDTLQITSRRCADLVLIPRQDVREGVLVKHTLLRLTPRPRAHADDTAEKKERQIRLLRPVARLPTNYCEAHTPQLLRCLSRMNSLYWMGNWSVG